MKNMMSIQTQTMAQTDLAQQLKDLQSARPARPVQPANDNKAPFDINRNDPVRPDDHRDIEPREQREDFDDVFSDQMNTQNNEPARSETKAETSTDKTSDVESEANCDGADKGSVAIEEKTTQRSGVDNVTKQASKGAPFNKKGMQNPLLQNMKNQLGEKVLTEAKQDAQAKQANQFKAEMLPLALSQSKENTQLAMAAEQVTSKQLTQLGQSLKKPDSKSNQVKLEMGDKAVMPQNVQVKTTENPNLQNNTTQAQTQGQAEQQQHTDTAKNASQDDNFKPFEQAMKSENNPTAKTAGPRSKTNKGSDPKFGLRGTNPAAKSGANVAGKAGPVTGSSGVNKNFAQVQDLIDPKVKVQIDGHDANIRVATEKAGEVAVRLQMKQEGVADIRLAGENAAVFDKKDELQAALQAEGLDLGQFNLSQDLEEREGHEQSEDFEDDELGNAESAVQAQTAKRVRNGATMHVQA
ncbi:MAG: hypothetical protein CMH56_12780 [Myxococcales bacterium]|nr:hypothetical protein [Myxococcales bacterium]|tara:strand:- start:179 stop:1579 length:1401 start_codon:yes stop_codon:yes gene_type:complete